MNTTARETIRTKLLAERRAFPHDQAAAAAAQVAPAITEKLNGQRAAGTAADTGAVLGAGTGRIVAAYRALPGEIDPSPAIDALIGSGWSLVLPVCGEGGHMEFCPFEEGDELQPSSFGVLEPTSQPVPITAIDALIVPGVAFDRTGNRLGHGVGFYDRFFDRCAQQSHDPYRLGIAYDFQVVDLPAPEPWDIPMHSVVSPSEVIDTSLCE